MFTNKTMEIRSKSLFSVPDPRFVFAFQKRFSRALCPLFSVRVALNVALCSVHLFGMRLLNRFARVSAERECGRREEKTAINWK